MDTAVITTTSIKKTNNKDKKVAERQLFIYKWAPEMIK